MSTIRWYVWKVWHAARYYWPRAKARKQTLARFQAQVEEMGEDWPAYRRDYLTRKPWWNPVNVCSWLYWRWHRLRGGWRCKIGIHRLRGYRDCGDDIHVAPYNPRAARPARGAWRKCEWCGATWTAAYDGIAPYWQRKS